MPQHLTAMPVTGSAETSESDGYMASAQLARSLGVVSHATETYSVGGFRYTNLADAIAQAHRMTKLERELL